MAIGQIPGSGSPGGIFSNDPNRLHLLLEQFTKNVLALLEKLEELPVGSNIPPDLKEGIRDLAGQAGDLEKQPGLSNKQIGDLSNVQAFLQNIANSGKITDSTSEVISWIQQALNGLL